MRSALSTSILAVVLLLRAANSIADDERTQYPPFLAKAYFDVGIGYIDYPFTARQLEPGFEVESIRIPHAAARIVLLGHRFNEHLAAQVSYMRPVEWVGYVNVNGVPAKRTVWMNLAGLTLRATAPLVGPLSIDGEGGLGIVTRRGFEAGDLPVIKDANYWTVLLGGGLRYRLNPSWDLGVNAIYAPSNSRTKQPHTLMLSGGFTFNMRRLSEEHVRENAQAGFAFPRNLVQVSYTTDAGGFGVNHLVAGGAVPVFWGGSAQVSHGLAVRYERNVFHARRVFSLDLGASVSHWTSRANREKFFTASLFPAFRLTPLRFRMADLYFTYSLAGPAAISRVVVDRHDTGRHFTFQDFMGIGMYAGRNRRVNAEIQIGHYSNGNLFSQNAGVSVPLTFSLGYTF
jgi:Lipid A 3-O-deacylase (PagL)